MKRSGKDVPTGVFILAGLSFLKGFHYIIFGLIAIMHSFMTTIISLIMGSLLIVCGSWLISLQSRGWMLATIGSILYLLYALAKISLSGSLAAGLIEAIIAVIILYYLNRTDTKQAFRR